MSELVTSNDGFAVKENSASNLIDGKLVKFNEKYLADKVAMESDDLVPLAVMGIATVWVHWKDNRPTEHLVTQTGQNHPLRDELGDLDESEWPPGLNDEPSDPWRDTRYLRLVHLKTGAGYTFVTDSKGGIRATADLKAAVARVRFANPGAVPVIQLATTTWKTKYGQKTRPDFKVIGWRGPQGQTSLTKDDMDDSIPF
jgi:hypothetical protein